MTKFRSSLPVRGPRSPAGTKRLLQDTNQDTVKPRTISKADNTKSSKSRDTITRIGRPLPASCSDKSLRAPGTKRQSGVDVKPSASTPDVSKESMSSSFESSGSSKQNKHNTESESSRSSSECSRYNGPQLAEPCVGHALLHVLHPCGHRVMTRDVQLCGQNCKGSDTSFANARTREKFVCAVCISRYVQEHYAAKKALFIPSLDKLENALGGFKAGWKDKRIARIERVWKNDALEEQRALEKLGRCCEAVFTDPDEVLVDVEGHTTPALEQSTEPAVEVRSDIHPVANLKTSRLQIPVPTEPKKKSQVPSLIPHTTINKKAVESERTSKRTSRIPMGPRLPRK